MTSPFDNSGFDQRCIDQARLELSLSSDGNPYSERSALDNVMRILARAQEIKQEKGR